MHQHKLHQSGIPTSRLTQWVRQSGTGTPVLLIHGNASDGVFWEGVMEGLPDHWCIAPDLRGYGQTEDLTIDATRGTQDWVDDLLALLETLKIEQYHVVGHSLGGAVVWGLLCEDSTRILSATVVAPGSPYGFGGTRGENGEPCTPDFAGSGGGTVNPDFPKRIAAQDRSSEPNSPRDVMRKYYFKPPFETEQEEALLTGLLNEKVGPDRYPGDFEPSAAWPFVAPGKLGPINAISGKHAVGVASELIQLSDKPSVLWVRGDSDQIVSDQSLFDLGTLGMLGAVPGWPGMDDFPPQPMVSQTRHVLEQYGPYREVVYENTGHTPFIEQPERFLNDLAQHLRGALSPAHKEPQ